MKKATKQSRATERRKRRQRAQADQRERELAWRARHTTRRKLSSQLRRALAYRPPEPVRCRGGRA